MQSAKALSVVAEMLAASGREPFFLDQAKLQELNNGRLRDLPNLVFSDIWGKPVVAKVEFIDCRLNGTRFNSLFSRWEPSLIYITVIQENMYGHGLMNVIKMVRNEPAISSVLMQHSWVIDPQAFARCEAEILNI